MSAKRSTLTNKGKTTYDQTINGKRYLIKPGETVELDRYEAVDVKGWYIGYGNPVSLEIKHLYNKDEDDKPGKIYCALDGKEFNSKSECEEYMAALKKGK